MVPNSKITNNDIYIVSNSDADSTGSVSYFFEYLTATQASDVFDVLSAITPDIYIQQRRKRYKRVQAQKINLMLNLIPTIILIRRMMFAKSGYLPWRVRKRFKNT